MLISKIKTKYQAEARKRLDKQNNGGVTPSGSRLGTCAAQLQMLQFPKLTKPTALPPRSLMVFEEGDRIEAWFVKEIQEAVDGQWGLQQQPFHLEVPLDARDYAVAREKGARRWGQPGRLWTSELPEFLPAAVSELPAGGNGGKPSYRYRAAPPEAKGVILDPATHSAWIPVRVDGIVKHDQVGLAVAEIKSMSNWAFRQACLGQMGYGYRCQMAAARKASGLNIVHFVCRKETFHLGEIAIDGSLPSGKVRVDIERLSGQHEVFFADIVGEDGEAHVTNALGGEAEIPHDDLWDLATVVSPFDARLIEEIQERVRTVLVADGSTWTREYGPSFICPRCGGTGQQTMAKGTSKPLKTPKPCEDCEMMGWLTETTLPRFPCGYCPVVQTCYPMARLEVTERPTYYVAKADWERAGLSYSRPKSF